jgi:sialidase-1
VGPGVGTKLSDGTLVVPAMHRNFYSTDDGTTWQLSKILNKGTGKLQTNTGEATVLAVTDGTTAGAGTYNTLYRNDREYTAGTQAYKRWVTRGTISGGYDTFTTDSALNDPGMEGSTLRYNTSSPTRILFMNSNSPSTESGGAYSREWMRVRVSCDEGQTWKYSRALSDAPLPSYPDGEGGYSSMAKTADGYAGALVEVNEDDSANATSHRSIAFRKFNISWILNGGTDCS